MKYRLFSMLLATVMVFTSVDMTAFAKNSVQETTAAETVAETESDEQEVSPEEAVSSEIETGTADEEGAETTDAVETQEEESSSEVLSETVSEEEPYSTESESITETVAETLVEESIETTEEAVTVEEESVMESTQEDVQTEDDSVPVHSGSITDNGANVTWTIDNLGKLVIKGTAAGTLGSYSYPWLTYRADIISAEVEVTGLTDLSCFFQNCSNLKSVDVSGLDTSAVTKMYSMFYNCKALTELDLSSWKTENVTSMNSMFSGCSALTKLDVTGWNTGKVTTMSQMFSNCKSLETLDLTGWNTSNVENMANMFEYCSALTKLDLNNWKTEKVTDMSKMFYYSGLIELEVSDWDTSNVKNMGNMFGYCEELTKLDVSGWDTGNVTTMNYMFYVCDSLPELDVSGWNTEKVTNMSNMFKGCREVSKLDVSDWDTGNVTDMQFLFNWCLRVSELDVSKWDTSKVTNMRSMFTNCDVAKLDVSDWDTSKVTNMSEMFAGLSDLTELDISGLETEKVTDMGGMFSGCSRLTQLDLSKLQTGSVIKMNAMFSGCDALTKVDFSNLNTEKVTDMSSMFNSCDGLTEITLNGLDTQSVTNMGNMFSNCKALTKIDLSGLDFGKVTNVRYMFYNCEALSAITLDGLNTSNITNASFMFYGCKALEELDLSTLDMGKVTNGTMMLEGCEKLTLIQAPLNVTIGNDISLPTDGEDSWYLLGGQATTILPEGLTESCEIKRNRVPVGDILIEDITINGRGIACATFVLVDNEGEILKNREIVYYLKEDGNGATVSGSNGASESEKPLFVTSDTNGYIRIDSLELANETGAVESKTIQTSQIVLLDKAGNEEEVLNYNVIMNAQIAPLSFKQSWSMGMEGALTGKIAEGVGGSIGVANLEASLATAEIKGTAGGNLSVEHEFENGVRNLTFLQTYNAGIAAKADAGIALEAGVVGKDVEASIVSAGAGVSGAGNCGIGLVVEDYEPGNLEQITEIGTFMLASQAQVSNDLLWCQLAELMGLDFYNLTKTGSAIAVEANANVGAVEIEDVCEGALASAEGKVLYTYDSKTNKETGAKESSFGREVLTETKIGGSEFEAPGAGLGVDLYSEEDDQKIELTAAMDKTGTNQKFSVKGEIAYGDEVYFLEKGTSEAVTVTYENDEIDRIKNDTVQRFVNGETHYIFWPYRTEMLDELEQTSAKGNYSYTITDFTKEELEFDIGITVGLGLEAGVAFEGAQACEYEKQNGIFKDGILYINNINYNEKEIKENSYSGINELVKESIDVVSECVVDFLKDSYGSAKEGVKNGWAKVKSLGESLVPDWVLHLVSLNKDDTTTPEDVQSYEITAYSLVQMEDLLSGEEVTVSENRVYTVGDPYYVYVTDAESNEVTDYSENPLELTLEYTDEMLTAAGVTEAELEKLAIYQHSQEVLGYVCLGGELDKENKCVTLTITKPGQYLLAVDAKAPTVTKFDVELNENKPFVTVGFDEDCGFKEFSLKIDDTECISTDNWNEYYNKALREFTYQSETVLGEGDHTVTVYAVDSAGNMMTEPFIYNFRIDTQPPVLQDLKLTCEEDVLSISVSSNDIDIASVTATVSQNQLDEVVKTSGLEMTVGDDGDYCATITLEEGVDLVSVSVNAVDNSGNKSVPLFESKKLEDDNPDDDPDDDPDNPDDDPDDVLQEGLRYVFVDGSGEDKSQYTYTGSAIKPKVLIYDGNTLLREKKDYTLSYSKNKNVGEGEITVTGAGNYGNKTIIKFSILQKDISDITDQSITVAELTAVENGKVKNPVPVITYNKKKLSNKNNKDFEVTYPDTKEGAYKEAGTYTVHVEGKGNYEGGRDITFMIGGKKTNKLTVEKIAACDYNGSAFTPEVIVKDGRNTLKKGTHYTVEYKDNTEVGTAKVIITGILPAYAGTKTVTFKIKGVSMSKVDIDGIPKNVYYSGEAYKLKLSLTYEDEPLFEGTHYRVEYGANTEVGKGTVTITGMDRYGGTVTKSFKILPFETKKDTEGQLTVQEGTSIVYAKGGAKPEPVVKFNETVLTQGTDYTLSYANNKAVTTQETKKKPSVTVTFKGKYKGTKKVNFTITPQSLDVLTATGVDKVESNKKNKWKSTVVIEDLNGKVLKAGTDYEKVLKYYLDEECTIPADADTYEEDTIIWVKVTGKGNYAGSETVTSYRILGKGKSIANAKVKIKDQTYNGGKITIDQSQIEYVKINGEYLTFNEQYMIVPESYKNNVVKGTATVQLKGIDDYGGTYTAKFKITRKAFEWKKLLEALGISL